MKVFADGKEVLNRWRQNWNPWYHNFELAMTAGKPVDVRIEWEPNQGYIALFHADPLPEPTATRSASRPRPARRSTITVVPGDDMDALVAGYRPLTGKAPMMPRWAYGFWQSRQRYETQDALVGVLREYREARPPDRQGRAGLVLLARGRSGAATASIRRASPTRKAWSTRSTRSTRGS